jgi:hypothetical protein
MRVSIASIKQNKPALLLILSLIIITAFLGFGYQPVSKKLAERGVRNQINDIQLGVAPLYEEVKDKGCQTITQAPLIGWGHHPIYCKIVGEKYYKSSGDARELAVSLEGELAKAGWADKSGGGGRLIDDIKLSEKLFAQSGVKRNNL